MPRNPNYLQSCHSTRNHLMRPHSAVTGHRSGHRPLEPRHVLNPPAVASSQALPVIEFSSRITARRDLWVLRYHLHPAFPATLGAIRFMEMKIRRSWWHSRRTAHDARWPAAPTVAAKSLCHNGAGHNEDVNSPSAQEPQPHVPSVRTSLTRKPARHYLTAQLASRSWCVGQSLPRQLR